LRVGLFATSVAFGGIEQVLLTLLEHMDPAVTLVPIVFTRTDTKETSFFDRLEAMGVPHETLYVNITRPVYVLNPLRNLAEAIVLCRRHRLDLIHSHGYRADTFALAVSRLLRIPVVSTCHGFIRNDRRLRVYNQLDHLVLRFFTRIVAVSEPMRTELIGAGIDATRVQVITNAIPEVPDSEREQRRRDTRAELGIGRDDFVFGYVGRLSEEKGLDDLLEAAGLLLPSLPASRLLLVGAGPRKEMLEQTARRHGIEGRVHFAGFQTRTSEWYPAMDAFVLPSLTEGTPMALLEAMAHRLPIVATAVGGIPGMITHGKNGLLVPAGDQTKLLEAMRALATDPDLRQELSLCGRRSVREAYDVQNWIRLMCEVYMTTTQRPGLAS
jgi:glycosyltransferase involved in cell wall biosynthesis